MSYRNKIKRKAIQSPWIAQGKWISDYVAKHLPVQIIAYIWLLSESISTQDTPYVTKIKILKIEQGCRVLVGINNQKTSSNLKINVKANYEVKIMWEQDKQVMYSYNEGDLQDIHINQYKTFDIASPKRVYLDEKLKFRLTSNQQKILSWLAYESSWYYKYKTIKGITSDANSIEYTFNDIFYKSKLTQLVLRQKGRCVEVTKEWLLDKKHREKFEVDDIGGELWNTYQLSIGIFQRYIIVSECYNQEWMDNENEHLHYEWLYDQYCKSVSNTNKNKHYNLEEEHYYEIKFK